MQNRCRVERVSGEVIENKILESLEDGGHVACVFTYDDLLAVLNALAAVACPTQRQISLKRDLTTLLTSAWPEGNQ